MGNYEPAPVKNSGGPGENGEPVYSTMEERAKSDQSIRDYGFNLVNSDKISLDRTVPDTRMDECKYWHYPEKLPSASVILVFHNEGWSTLVRTVHSVINSSPSHLLKEVVMVDDFSDKEHLKGKLDQYMTRFNGKVKIFRNEERLGLIRTRTRGAELSTGEVIVFLDAHCECNPNWLPPLLARIAHDRTIMAVPIVDGIDWNNFRYRPVYTSTHHRGIFEWGFLYKESQVPQRELNTRTYNSEPYKSPTHAGGLFAMDRKYFFEMGGYDPGMQIWGGENFELSFKIWQCGGSIEWVPCSRVGHVYRNHMPYGFGKVKATIPVILLNYMRVVEVWLDPEYKEYFYTREPSVRGYPIGDISKQLAFKKEHNCKSFDWFMENVAYEVLEKFPRLPPNKVWGEFKILEDNKCWDTVGQGVNGGPIGAYYCHHGGGNQMFRLNTKGQLALGERCLEAKYKDTIHVSYCDVEPTGPWDYDEKTKQVQHTEYEMCVELGDDDKLHLQTCDAESQRQLWEVNEVRSWK
ncbi:hypothetical protein LOTGIDRAFT_194702 [Lottia gigantea]|uniref:Polypeptide N-acetylgalactosaminyltransferase n=1 Tax=Lottia gigantea TaxID=225164 RepID=V3ZR56_LOTGI|nr:hypothetical protein LOTGIDRAFT_194702 [Lottia gigantea]ESO86827.1 hypothetical protein LOTGIDRAFT_194702 [Lottia gigantea]